MSLSTAAPTSRRVLLAVVADDAADREAISAAFAADKKHRVISSSPLEDAEVAIAGEDIDAIIGFVEDENGWRAFRSLAERFADHLSVLLVNDPDQVDTSTGVPVLNAVVHLRRNDLIHAAPEVAIAAEQALGLQGRALSEADAQDRDRLALLSDREREVLALTAEGYSIKEIAMKIQRSYATVASHRHNLMEKLGLHDKVALTRFAIRARLVEI